ncbi:neurosecretory protein VGF [Esox lucius]|uniref:VGF nerve growth factor inducible n=1 Tax=Esox lucius TaxID=8010 RepID=A0A3P8ZUN1_ESOLU|nr:neurosecretory protein VGF [Esox lucius]
MTQCRFTASALILLVVLLGLTITLPLATSIPVATESPGLSESSSPPPPELKLPEGERDQREGREGGPPRRERAEGRADEDDELFGNMDPKMLAAVLLEAMNKPHMERMPGTVGDGRKEERGEEENGGEVQEDEETKGEEVRAALDEEGADRDRDGREELELAMAAAAVKGKEEQEREEEEERKRAQEEEDRLTEKVSSRTTSQMVPVKEKQPPAEGAVEVGVGKEVGAREEAQKGPPISQQTQQAEEEEQLSPEEVQNLQSMLEELQNYNTANKRERDSQAQEQRDRESRGYSQDEPKAKGYPLAMSKKKLKWQEETQKALSMPTYRGGNFMDDFNNNLDLPVEDEDEVLSPQEEERRAKEEQEEVRRQAAEAQRAKVEEEKLADIASDMLLQYMVKQDKGKYSDQKKPLLSNAAEDKRSDEDEVSEDDDIDPQTIDKLIEISSKLHLPADDVVDIISDVEKKKKKDAPETIPWQRFQQRPLVSLETPAVDTQPSAPRYPTLKQPPTAINPLKAWFKDKSSIKPAKQDQNLWIKPQQMSPRTSSSYSYPTYPFYQQKPYQGYYPIYFTLPKPKTRFYAKPSVSFNNLLSNSLYYDFDFPPKRRYRPWVQPRLRNPPAALRRNLLYPNYLLPPRHRTYNPLPVPVPVPKPRSSPLRPPIQIQPRHRHGYYYQAPAAPLVTRDQDYYGMGQQQQDSNEDLENYIQQVVMKPRPRMFQ